MKAAATKFRVSIASTPAEKVQLISLRTKVYRQSGKHTNLKVMSDNFDEKALIVGVWKDGRPIATARVLALDPHDEWEHDRFINWDDSMPDREETAEISRFCVDYRERSWITIKALCSGIAQAIINTRRRYFVACCTDELVPFYKTFFGAEFTGESIIHSDLGPKEHHMFVCDYQLGMVGVNIDFFGWLSLWPKLASTGLSNGNLLPWIPPWRRRLFFLKCTVGGLAEPLATTIWAAIFFFRVTNKGAKRGKYIISIAGGVCTLIAVWYLAVEGRSNLLSSVVSLCLFFCAHILFWWSYATCRQRPFDFAFSSIPPRFLMADGPYRFLRHPFYTSYLMGWLGAAIAVWSFATAGAVFTMFIIYWLAATKEEDVILSSDLNHEYRDYRTNTGMFLPKLF